MINRLKLKRHIGKCFGRFTASKQRTVILLYHSIGESPLSVPETLFREQMAWLAARFAIVPLDAVVTDNKKTTAQVVISFDDGYASVHDRAAPIMAEHGATGTVYLNTGWIGDIARKASDAALGHYPHQYFMNWREAEALAKAGWTIGSHGVDHLDLTKQDAVSVERELSDSKQEIENRLERPCEHFAYTWGRFTPSLQNSVNRAGYTSAVSGLHGPVAARADYFALPRIDIRAEYEMQDFAAVVSGHWDYLGFKQRLARRLV